MTRPTIDEIEQRLRDTFAATDGLPERWHGSGDAHLLALADPAEDVEGTSPIATTRRLRRWSAPMVAAAAVLAVAGLAVGLSVAKSDGEGPSMASSHTAAADKSNPNQPTSARTSGAPSASVSASAPTTAASEPAWVKACIPTTDGPAPGYVGHDVSELGALAQQRGEHPIVFAADGKCVPRTAIGAPIGGPKMVAVATETVTGGAQKVVYAAYVNPRTGQ